MKNAAKARQVRMPNQYHNSVACEARFEGRRHDAAFVFRSAASLALERQFLINPASGERDASGRRSGPTDDQKRRQVAALQSRCAAILSAKIAARSFVCARSALWSASRMAGFRVPERSEPRIATTVSHKSS